jgi:HD-like signal output (HDOD) protein
LLRSCGKALYYQAVFGMICVLLVVLNERERQILSLAFSQLNVKVITAQPGYHNYIKLQQYLPDLVVMELPQLHTEQLHFVHLIRSHKKTSTTPIIGYGEPMDASIQRGLKQRGINAFHNRPLKFTRIIQEFKRYLQASNKNLDEAQKQNSSLENQHALLSADTPARKKIELIATSISKLLAFPFTIAKVVQITRNQKSGASDLAHAIQADPAISTHLLRVSNSVFFASLNRRINTIKDCIVRIGFNETRRIVLTMSVMKLMDTRQKGAGFDRTEFWRHSIATGVISSLLARHQGSINTEEAFLTGLLHDFGILLLEEFFPEVFAQLLEHTTEHGCEFLQSQQELMGMTHNDVIGELFPAWKMPESITTAITTQKLATTPSSMEDGGQALAHCTRMANLIAKSLGLGRECDAYIYPLPRAVFESVHLGAGITPAVIERIHHDIAIINQMLELDETSTTAKQEYASHIGIINQGQSSFIPPLHYLKAQGYTVTPLRPNTTPSQYKTRFDLLLAWSEQPLEPQELQQLHALASADQPLPLPLVLMCPADALPPQQPNLFTIGHPCDLREIDKMVLQRIAPPLDTSPSPPPLSDSAG